MMNVSLKEETIAQTFLDILQGVKAIHSKNIIHSDLKPDNIILKHDFKPVIIDMGFATQIKKE